MDDLIPTSCHADGQKDHNRASSSSNVETDRHDRITGALAMLRSIATFPTHPRRESLAVRSTAWAQMQPNLQIWRNWEECSGYMSVRSDSDCELLFRRCLSEIFLILFHSGFESRTSCLPSRFHQRNVTAALPRAGVHSRGFAAAALALALVVTTADGIGDAGNVP